MAPNDLCFFTGHVSSWLANEESYLIDGVAINGVSGGPAFSNDPEFCGVVTAYIPNRATGESLPGVCLVRDVAPYEAKLNELQSLEEAQSESEGSDGEDGGLPNRALQLTPHRSAQSIRKEMGISPISGGATPSRGKWG